MYFSECCMTMLNVIYSCNALYNNVVFISVGYFHRIMPLKVKWIFILWAIVFLLHLKSVRLASTKMTWIYFADPNKSNNNNIYRLTNKNSCGYDHVSNRTMKANNHSFSPYLEIIFSKCTNEDVFPDLYKIAQVIPLFKGGNKEDSNCYRPISLLPTIISKILEKLLATRKISYSFSLRTKCFLKISLVLGLNSQLNML